MSNNSYEKLYAEGVEKINSLNIQQLKEFRKSLIIELNQITTLLKTEEMATNERKRKFFSGLRRMVTSPLLNYSKNRLKMLNRVVYNGVTISHAKRFVEIAADILSMDLFQQIYGLSLSKEEKENQTIDDIKKFIVECEAKEKDGNI